MASLWQSAPLSGIKVVELAGLAPGPFTGLLLADYGASVLRIDRAHASAYTSSPPPATSDNLVRHKSSLTLNLKSPGGLAVLRALLTTADVLIDPYRPGVLESLGLPPSHLHTINPRLIVARLTGFRRDGKYAPLAGHDINYLAVSGVLSQLGRRVDPQAATGQSGGNGRVLPPDFPGNLLGDFAAGGLMCATGVLFALLARDRNGGKGQVVESNMVDGTAYIGTFLRLNRKMPWQDGPRGSNMLDGGSPWYDVYETKDEGGYMAVGALEPQFFRLLIEGLGLNEGWNEWRWDRDRWQELRELMTRTFKERTRAEWEQVFDEKDACCTPVLGQEELEESGYEQRPAVGLSASPSRKIDQIEAWNPTGLVPGSGGRKVLEEWLGWEEGRQYEIEKGGLVKKVDAKL